MPIWLLYSSMFMMVRCADLQSGSGILRYLWWYTVPIWLLYSSIFMVVRCADLVSGVLDIYGGTLCRSGFWILDSGFFDVSLMFSLMFASVPYSGFFLSAGSVSQRKVALDHIPPGPMPPSSGVPLHPSHKTSKASPTASTERYHLPLASLDHIHTHKKKPGIFIFQRHRTPISHI